jgi:hypothetical protein
MADKCATLQRTITPTQALLDAGSQIQLSNNSFIYYLLTELTAQESDVATLSECLPSTSAFLRGRETVKNAVIALQAALEEQLGSIGQRVAAVKEELEITKELSGHMSHSMDVFSTATNDVQKGIVARSKNFLHPIRRLPAEILQRIFEECVDAEAAEWFVDPTGSPSHLQSATRIAGTCRSWRTIAHQTPRMWNRLRAPIQAGTYNGVKQGTRRITGRRAFWASLRLCGSIPLEVTIPEHVSLPEKPNLMSLKIDRLNFDNVCDYDWSRPPSFPSPLYLWVGRGNSRVLHTQELPSSLISRTTTITAHHVAVAIPEGSNQVTQLILRGLQDGFRLTSLLKSLPCLNELDAGSARVVYWYKQVHPALTHQSLRHLRIHISFVHALEYYLAKGLRLPGLSCFGLTCQSMLHYGPLHYTSSSFPSVSAQLPTTVTHLEVHGEHAVTTSSTSDLIETFYGVDTISTYGNAVGAILLALCRTRDTLEGEKPSAEEKLPSSVRVLHIHDYIGNGKDLYPALRQIYNSIEAIKVSFENCPNILPTMRGEFTHV